MIQEVRRVCEQIRYTTPQAEASLTSPAKYLLDMAKLDEIASEEVIQTLRVLNEVNMVHLPHPAIYIEVLNVTIGPGDTCRMAILASEEEGKIAFYVLVKHAKWRPVPAVGMILTSDFMDLHGYNIKMQRLFQYEARSGLSLTRTQNLMIEAAAAIVRLIVLRNTLHVVEEERRFQIPPGLPGRGQKPRSEVYRVLRLKEVVRRSVADAGISGVTYRDRKPPRLHLRTAHIWGRFTRPEDEWQFRPSQIIGLADRGFVDKTYTFV